MGPRRRRAAFEIDGFGGGVLTTASNLLFQGRGTITGELIAFDATTGERLWSHETPNSMAPGPISYAVGGEQYIAVMGGRGFSGGNDADARARNPGRIFAFKLDGKATLPPGPGPAPPRESARADLLRRSWSPRARSPIACIARAATAAKRTR